MNQKKETAIIIGAGPAGLTAAYELLDKTDILPVIFEMTNDIGGISKTVRYKGNRIDIGGHRFFSKSEKVMNWWVNILPLQGKPSIDDKLLNRKIPLSHNGKAPDPEKDEQVMLYRGRVSRIFFLKKFFDYPISLNLSTMINLGLKRLSTIGISYIKSKYYPIKPEKTLEDFFINRFGEELYRYFFKDYTKKVWGVCCNKIKPEWGAQRVKGLSIFSAIMHAIKSIVIKDKSIIQKSVETTLIEQFMYPKYGPGQMWETVAEKIQNKGGVFYFNHRVMGIIRSKQKNIIRSIIAKNNETGEKKNFKGDYFISSMPVKDLINSFQNGVPREVRKTSNGLKYRDFITIGLLVKKLKYKNTTKIKTLNNLIPDNWIYIQERDVKVGRIQIFNNWSPYLVKNPDYVWLGTEYFCNEGDALWNKGDKELKRLAVEEMQKLGFIDEKDVIDSIVIKMPKTYPAYFGSYDKFSIIQSYLDGYRNLFLIGRNGMHKYNNMDHSMLTAMESVDNIINKVDTKENVWAVNAEKEYHEEK